MTLNQFHIANIPIAVLLLLVSLTALLLVLTYIQIKNDSLDLRWLILDDSTGHPSIHKLGLLVSLVVSTWGFAYNVMHNTLSELYLTTYMGIWAGSTALNKYLSSKQ